MSRSWRAKESFSPSSENTSWPSSTSATAPSWPELRLRTRTRIQDLGYSTQGGQLAVLSGAGCAAETCRGSGGGDEGGADGASYWATRLGSQPSTASALPTARRQPTGYPHIRLEERLDMTLA